MKILSLLFSYLPSVLAAVVSAESVIAAQGTGADKKELVLSVIQAAAQVGEAVDQKTVSGIAALVDSVVGVLNKSGIFGHKTAAPVAN